MPTTYRVIWHTDHACDSLGDYDTYAEAEAAGESWLLMMCGIDPDPRGAAREYAYEIDEIEED